MERCGIKKKNKNRTQARRNQPPQIFAKFYFLWIERNSFKVKNNTKLQNKSLLIFITLLLSSTPEMVYPVSNAL